MIEMCNLLCEQFIFVSSACSKWNLWLHFPDLPQYFMFECTVFQLAQFCQSYTSYLCSLTAECVQCTCFFHSWQSIQYSQDDLSCCAYLSQFIPHCHCTACPHTPNCTYCHFFTTYLFYCNSNSFHYIPVRLTFLLLPRFIMH